MSCDSIGNGSWVTAGITTDDVMIQSIKSENLTTITCRSTHLTSFAVLVDVAGGLKVKYLCLIDCNILACFFKQVIDVAE